MVQECFTKELEAQTVQSSNENWKEKEKRANEGNSDIIVRNKLNDNLAFMNKPSKFDEHVEDEQYVDNPLLATAIASPTLQLTNVTRVPLFNTSANHITSNYTERSCNYSSSSNATNCEPFMGTETHVIKLTNLKMSNESSYSAVVRKRNSANESTELPNDLFNFKSSASTTIYYKPFYDYKNTSKNYSFNDNRTSRYPDAGNWSNPSKLYHKTHPNEGNPLTFKIKKETENYRILEKRKRIRRRNRVRRSLYQLPFNDMMYRPLHRRHYYLHSNDRMDLWDQYDQHRRYVRFPLASDTFRSNRPLNGPPPPPPPPPPSSAIWTPPQLPQYTAYQQSLPPVPSMGPRSPRLVFRDPVEPGTLQVPFSSNGLQDLTAPEDNRGM